MVDGREDAAERVVRGDAVGQLQKGLEPVLPGAAEKFHVREPLADGQGRAQADDQNIDQLVSAGAVGARVGQALETLDDAAGPGQSRRRLLQAFSFRVDLTKDIYIYIIMV